jgi:hypothetical protein
MALGHKNEVDKLITRPIEMDLTAIVTSRAI